MTFRHIKGKKGDAYEFNLHVMNVVGNHVTEVIIDPVINNDGIGGG